MTQALVSSSSKVIRILRPDQEGKVSVADFKFSSTEENIAKATGKPASLSVYDSDLATPDQARALMAADLSKYKAYCTLQVSEVRIICSSIDSWCDIKRSPLLVVDS